jgi:antirestriction factor ArdC-like protein
MKSEQIKQIIEKASEQLVAALHAGHSEALTEYLKAIARFHRYSLGNVMLITLQKPDASHVAGFHAWQKLGRFVRKGEKGILILAPIVQHKRDEDEEDGTGVFPVLGFRAAFVFDLSQTDGRELPHVGTVGGDPHMHLKRLAEFTARQGITLDYSEEIAPARGISGGGRITLLPGQSPAEEFSTFVHELAHEFLHRGARRSGTSKRSRETEAEAVAFVVCQAVGLETGSAATDYIQLWNGDAQLLTESLGMVQQTAVRILDGIAGEPSSSAKFGTNGDSS